jgi:hypothetical protein
MGRELGRISGPLLADNLLRNGNDLAFETSLLYLNVSNGYIGVNNNTPTKAFDITGTTYAPTVIVDTEADLSQLIFTTNQIQNLFDAINIVPDQASSPNIVVPSLATNKLTLKNNAITNYVSGDNLIFASTGQVVIGTPLANNNVLVSGNLHATGNITFDGDIILGSGPTNQISIPGEVNSDILPTAPIIDLADEFNNLLTDESSNLIIQDGASIPFNLGSGSLLWNNVYSNALQTGSITNTNIVTGSMTIGNITINNDSITNTLSDNNLQFTVSGTGVMNFNNTLTVKAGDITYNQNSPLNFAFAADSVTGAKNGYLKFGGTNGFVPPVGTTAQRPLGAEIGELRFNTQLSILEVFANVSNSVTSFDYTTNQTVNAGTSTIYTTNTTGMKVGNLVTSSSLPGAFSYNTLVSTINPGISFTISNPLLLQLPSGSSVNTLQQWVPSIGLSPVLSIEDVTETMDIWTLILG